MQRRSLWRSFADAFAGFSETWRAERNMRIHTFMATLAVGAGRLGALSRGEWLLLFLTIAFVFAVELINTAIEAAVDLTTDAVRPLARTAKNAAAAAVLITAAGAVAAAWWLFVPRLPTYPAAFVGWWRLDPLGAAVWTAAALAAGCGALWVGSEKRRR
ncbi:MAG: diacylglycerol kinase family protein [Chloroflexota bacterium]